MKLPNRKNAIIKKEKITEYLLSLTHPEGKSKARFFRGIGFNETNMEEFEKALLKIGKSNEVVKIDKKKSEFVIKYIIDGIIESLNGKEYKVKTVWAINVGSERPHLSTAHPSRLSV